MFNMGFLPSLLPISYLFSVVSAVSFFTNATVPGNLSIACTEALLSDVSCDPVVPALLAGGFYPESTLERSCVSTCDDALNAYQAKIINQCSEETWLGYGNTTMAVAYIPELMRYHFNYTCLTDGGRFCNNVAAAYAAYLDPTTDPNSAPAGGLYGNISITDECDICLIKNLQFQAGSPYYDGPRIYSNSIYQSKTSSCGVTGYPITVTTNSISIPPAETTTPTPTCAGTIYTLQPGDDCHSVSLAQRIGTSWLLQDNDLAAACADFPETGELCLVNQCDVYTVQANDTCASIVSSRTITLAQFQAWNPNINAGCYNIEQMIGDQVCVGAPGVAYIPPSITATLAPITPTSAAPVPTNIADGTNTYCGQFYEVTVGEYCNLLAIRFAISLEDFTFLNPGVNENCTNLYAEESYCVQAVGDINTYSGRPGYQSYTATITSIDGDLATRWPNVAWTTPTPSSPTTQLPLATDTRDDCFQYFAGSQFQGYNTADSIFASDCDLAATVLGVTLEDLATWNPSLGNTTLSTCTFQPEARYCGVYYLGDPTFPTPDQSPIREGTITDNCTYYLDVFDGSGWICEDILDTYGITIAQFYKWNPSVGPDCAGLWIGYRYCVAGPVAATTTTTDPSPPTDTVTPGGPTQAGQPANCNKWYVAQDGDSCAAVINEFFITADQFYTWNPAVSENCDGFWKDYAYCVGTTDTTSVTRTETTTETPAATMVPAPDPHFENNAISSCNLYAQALDGDYCSLFAERNGITLAQLYAWNAVLGSDGSGCTTFFWVDYWWCVGIST